MATNNFIKNLWEARIIANFSEQCFVGNVTSAPTKTDGKVIYFNKPAVGVSKDYTGTIAWSEVTGQLVSLAMDKQKYFATSMGDVEKVQGNASALDAQVAEESAVMAEGINTDFLTKVVADVKTSNYPSKALAIKVDKLTAYDEIVNLGVLLGKNKTPMSDRFVFINSEVLGLLCKDDRFTRQPEILANGVVTNGRINGANVVVTECLPAGKVVMSHKSAVGFGKQLDEIEALRLQTSFSDGVRGLMSYGIAVLKPESVAVLNYTI